MSELYFYDCSRCGSHDVMTPAGGRLSCTCDKDVRSGKLTARELGGLVFATRVVDGEAVWRKSFAEIEGRAA